jgi:hypothetical protein
MPPPPLWAGRSKMPGKHGRVVGDWAGLGVGLVGEGLLGAHIVEDTVSILILPFLILWVRQQIELIFELKKVTLRQNYCKKIMLKRPLVGT